jgi:hypothetical protein
LLVNNSSAFFPTPGGGTVTLDVIAAASSIAAAAGGNWSLALLYDDESDPVTADQLNNIRGYDNATPANRPLLSITYVLGGDGHLWVPRLRVHAGLIGR